MTIDEAIEYHIKVATQRTIADEEMGANDKWNETKFMTKKESEQIIADNRQLAKWLTELKEAKRLLKSAVESLRWLALHTEDSYGSCVIRDDNAHNKCDNCPLDNPEYTDCKWEYEAEALKLIGDESSGI
ncbi:MAG: hypothetical protein BWY47_00098 [Bacteroidetes bacterium ADurb.Bin302]|nr:MAG: hypothetical protein BWY47_00098 [Bacteroidetes bacterium ADurb.Bin302]